MFSDTGFIFWSFLGNHHSHIHYSLLNLQLYPPCGMVMRIYLGMGKIYGKGSSMSRETDYKILR